MLEVVVPTEGTSLPKRPVGRPRLRPAGELEQVCPFHLPIPLLVRLDHWRGSKGWSRSLAVRDLLARGLAAEIPDLDPKTITDLPTRRRRGRPKGSIGRQRAKAPRPLAPPRLPPSPSSRNEEIITCYAGGKTVREVAALFGITPQRVAQIIRRYASRMTAAQRKEEAKAIAAKMVKTRMRDLTKQADEMIADAAKPDPVIEPTSVDPPAEPLPDIDQLSDDDLLALEAEVARRSAPQVEPKSDVSYDSKELLPSEREWLDRMFPHGMTKEDSQRLGEAYQMARVAKIPRGSKAYFDFMKLRIGA